MARMDDLSIEHVRSRTERDRDRRVRRGSSSAVRTVDTQRSSATVMVGIPAYNEAEMIADIVTAAARHADEVVVVDDGSEDETIARAESAGATVIAHTSNRGYGATLGTIFEHAREIGSEQLVILDGDGQHDPDDIPKLLDAQRTNGAEIVVGSRFVGGSKTSLPAYRRLGLLVINGLTNAGIRLRYSTTTAADTQSGFRAYGRDAIETFARSGEIGDGMGASLDILFRAARQGFDVEEVPTNIQYDIENPSSQHPVTHGLALLKAIFVELFSERSVRIATGALVALLTFVSAVVVFDLLGGTTPAIGLAAGGLILAIWLAYPNASRAVLKLANR